MIQPVRRQVVLGLFLITLAAVARAGVSRPVLHIPETATPPVLDGRLDDPCWQQAGVLTNFTQVVPVEGAAPSEHTELRVLYSRDYLYLGIRCYDREPSRIIVKQMQHDSSFSSDDKVTVSLDTFFRQREGYFFSFNPAGARTEGLIENRDEENDLWDTIWQVRARIDEQGWTAEVAIPFKSLSFDRTRDTWGLNVERVIRRKQEQVRWTAISPSQSVSTLAEFGELRGLTNLNQGLGLEVKPSSAVKYSDDTVTGDEDWKFRPSLDLTYNITPSLKANATFYTDFAEAEVDERIVNLTRFATFFPEKRDFFLQDSSLFLFGGLPAHEITPYHSRRIGLSPSGQPVTIFAGGRLTGRIRGTRVALLDVQQDASDGVDSKNLAVGRVSVPVFVESDLGAIFTHGDPRTNGVATLGGVDFNYLNSRLPDDKTLVGHAWFMGTTSDRAGGDDIAAGANLSYPNEPLELEVSFQHIGERFDPSLGFVRRTGIRDYQGSLDYVWRPNTALVRMVSVDVAPRFTTDLDNRLVAENHDIPRLTFETPAGDELSLVYSYEMDLLDEPDEIQPGIVIPTGEYWMNQFEVGVDTTAARPVSVEASFRTADYYTGHQHTWSGGLSLRPSRYVSAEFSYELEQIRLPQGDFDVRVVTTRLELALTPDLAWITITQYDNLSDNFGLNSRIHWTIQPGNDVFLVLNQGYDFNDWRFNRLTSEVALKVGATLRF